MTLHQLCEAIQSALTTDGSLEALTARLAQIAQEATR